MHLDDWAVGILERITQAVTRMRQPSRSDYDPHHVFSFLLHSIDQRSLMVRLEGYHLVPQFTCTRPQPIVDLRQRCVPIDTRLALPQRIEARSVQHQDAPFPLV